MRMEEREGEEEDEVTEWQRWERRVWRRSYKDTLLTFCIQGFLGNRTMLNCALLNSPKRLAGMLFGLPHNYGPYRPFFDATRYCTPNICRPLCKNHQGSVISTVQSLLRFFFHDLSYRHFLIYPRFSLVARGLRHHYDSVSHHTGDFFPGCCCF